MSSDYEIDLHNTDFRQHPELYRVGRGEQGVLSVEPYKSEILSHWRFKTVEEAYTSANKILALFMEYKEAGDFVGMDMARKFLQMGYTRARRYANHPSGRKYAPASKERSDKAEEHKILPQAADWATNEKAQAAQVFLSILEGVREDPGYKKLCKNTLIAMKRRQHGQRANTGGLLQCENRRHFSIRLFRDRLITPADKG